MILGVVTGISTEVVYAADEPPSQKVVLIEVRHTPESIERKIEQIAEEYGVDAEIMKTVIDCESNGSTTIQSYHIRPDGSREQSYGLAQWHIPSKNVAIDGRVFTEEMAKDPEIAIENMAWYFSRGLQGKWSCYNDIYGE